MVIPIHKGKSLLSNFILPGTIVNIQIIFGASKTIRVSPGSVGEFSAHNRFLARYVRGMSFFWGLRWTYETLHKNQISKIHIFLYKKRS